MPTPRRIPFVATRFRDVLPTQHDIERRLIDHLMRLRDDGWKAVAAEGQAEAEGGTKPKAGASLGDDDLPYGPSGVYALAHRRRRHFIREADEARIIRRARRYVEQVAASTGLGHLAKEDIQRLKVLRDGCALVAIPHRASRGRDRSVAARRDAVDGTGDGCGLARHAPVGARG